MRRVTIRLLGGRDLGEKGNPWKPIPQDEEDRSTEPISCACFPAHPGSVCVFQL